MLDYLSFACLVFVCHIIKHSYEDVPVNLCTFSEENFERNEISNLACIHQKEAAF